MTQARDVNGSAEEEDLPDADWSDEAADALSPDEQARPVPQGGPKWKAIEDYWERKRLREALQEDYLEDDE